MLVKIFFPSLFSIHMDCIHIEHFREEKLDNPFISFAIMALRVTRYHYELQFPFSHTHKKC